MLKDIKELQAKLHIVGDYLYDFADYVDRGNGYIQEYCGALADSLTDGEAIMDWGISNIDEVNEAINNYGWTGVDENVYIAMRYAYHDMILTEIEGELYDDLVFLALDLYVQYSNQTQMDTDTYKNFKSDIIECETFASIRDVVNEYADDVASK